MLGVEFVLLVTPNVLVGHAINRLPGVFSRVGAPGLAASSAVL